jgi:hypothetical protein
MKSKINRIIIFSLALLLSAMPAFADLVFCGQKNGTPCKFSDLVKLIYTGVNYLIGLAGLVAILYIVFGGMQMLLSAGNQAKVTEAKSTITYAITGLILVMLSYLIIGYVAALVFPDLGADPIKGLLQYLP